MFTPRPQNPALAVALILLATAFIAATTLLAKALGTAAIGPPLHPLQVSFGRFLFAFATFSLAAVAIRPTLTRVNPKLHLGRTAFGWLGVTLMFAAAAQIPLASATAISFLNPVFAMLLASVLLGERVGPLRWSAAAIAMIGALVLLRPGFGTFQPAALLALGAAAAMGVELIFLKMLAGREPPFQILLINNAIGLAIAGFAAAFVWHPPTGGQWLALAGIGVLMACAQTAFVNGMARADASFAAPFSYATLLFAALYDAAIFAELPGPVTWLGAGIIVSGGVLLALREARSTRNA